MSPETIQSRPAMGAWLREWLLDHGLPGWAQVMVPTWLMMQLLAMAAAVLVVGARDRRCVWPLCAGFVSAAFGSAVFGAAVRLPAFFASFEWRAFHGATIMSYGALAGLVAGYAGVVHWRRADVARALDVLAPALGVTIALARTGCYLAGCDFGAVTAAPWAARFPFGTLAFSLHARRGLVLPSDAMSLGVHPTQLYEVVVGALSALAALLVERFRPGRGAPFAAACAVYAVGRWLVELFRGDEPRYFVGPMSVAQWLSVAVLAIVVVASRRARRTLA